MNVVGSQNIYIKISVLEKKIDSLESKIDSLDSKLDEIINMVNDNNKDCKKMTSHIDFINGVYENVKAPMNFICSNINQRLIEK